MTLTSEERIAVGTIGWFDGQMVRVLADDGGDFVQCVKVGQGYSKRNGQVAVIRKHLRVESSSRLMNDIVHAEITETYDEVESLLGRISVQAQPDLVKALTTAKDALFEARTLTDGS